MLTINKKSHLNINNGTKLLIQLIYNKIHNYKHNINGDLIVKSKTNIPKFYNSINVKFMLTVGLVIAVLLSSMFFFIANETEQHLMSEVNEKATIAFEEIALIKQWDANFSGTYVEKTEGVESNPYLKKMGVETDIESVDGKIYTLKNPALMTRGSSSYSKEEDIIEFQITSLDLVNPLNEPNEFEIESLRSFKKGSTEATQVMERDGSLSYQYMAPLYVKEECLACHNNYNVGDMRGGMSVFIPMEATQNAIENSRNYLFWTAIIVITAVELLLFILLNMFVGKPVSELMKGVSHIASGKLDYRINVRSKDELGILSNSFNDMATDLRKFREDLEGMVKIRTNELEIANKQLVELINEQKLTEKELEKYSEELKHSNELKDLFTDILRHDLLNPAGLIKGFTEVLLKIEKDEHKLHMLTKIEKSNLKLIEMVEIAAKYAKFEINEDIEYQNIDISIILNNVIETFKPTLTDKQMTLEFETKGKYCAHINPIIEEVFANLLSNAIKYSPTGNKIIIDILDESEDWKVEFIDLGEGVSDENKPKLFERFTRANKSGIKGSGLGLAIVKRIIEMHNGNVGVEDNPKGQGSVFWVKIRKQPE